ncbi:MAG: diguanylate cyclase [Candidatus Accumulibacter sp.]|uniref:diguanylate cyclase domain-containing protein n=1 Tax=Accumulibacter sp. TaxID=2053492 RepID=UPI00287AFBD1|nr:diguanylate cyclase [Accumulibacter sp.]MDS4015115.1 diguanylate cyclase [Accumulibacter sp.]
MENPNLALRVLIIDQSRMVRAKLIKLISKHYGFREEADGEAGWQALVLDHSIHLVICSLSLPILDGEGLLARVRSSKLARLRRMPVLVIAGDNTEAMERALALGASDFINRAVSSNELLTRIETLLRLAAQQGEASDEAAQGRQHPNTGLPGRRQIETDTGRSVAQALRKETPVSIMILGFDRVDRLRDEYGEEMAREFQRRLASMLAKKVRREDSLGHYTDDDLVVVSPGTPYPASEIFARRLCEAFAVANITVHGERVDLTISIGVANTPVDRQNTAIALLALAAQRLKAARAAGGNRVVACLEHAQQPTAPAIGHAINLIKAGRETEVIPHLAALGQEVLPLLELLARELKLGLPLADLQQRMLDRVRKVEDARQA